MKIVLNRCFGGFGLSDEAVLLYAKLSGCNLTKNSNHDDTLWSEWTTDDGKQFIEYDIDRQDPNLIKVVEQLGEKASGHFSRLIVVEIPDGIVWKLTEYDGLEKIEENHRTWP